MQSKDFISSLFLQFSLRAKVFYSSVLCQIATVEDTAGDTVLGAHMHLLQRGAVKITDLHGAQTMVSEPSLILLPHGGTHSLEPEDAVAGADLVCAVIDWGVETHEALVLQMPNLMVTALTEAPELGEVAKLLFNEAFSDRNGREASIDRLTEYLLLLFLRRLTEQKSIEIGVLSAMADRQLANALNAMHLYPERDWTLEKLAQVAGMSRARFAASFKSSVGMTPLRYLTCRRILVAKALLRKGRLIKEVAPRVGYSTATALTRAFTNLVGESPREWVSHLGSPLAADTART